MIIEIEGNQVDISGRYRESKTWLIGLKGIPAQQGRFRTIVRNTDEKDQNIIHC